MQEKGGIEVMCSMRDVVEVPWALVKVQHSRSGDAGTRSMMKVSRRRCSHCLGLWRSSRRAAVLPRFRDCSAEGRRSGQGPVVWLPVGREGRDVVES